MIIRRRRLVSSVSNHDASQNNTMILPMLTSTSAAASSNQVNIVSHDATLLGKFVAMIHVKMHANETHSRNAGGTTGASQRPKQTNPTVPPKNASTNATVRVKSSMRIVLRSTIKCPGKFACDTSWNVRLRHVLESSHSAEILTPTRTHATRAESRKLAWRRMQNA